MNHLLSISENRARYWGDEAPCNLLPCTLYLFHLQSRPAEFRPQRQIYTNQKAADLKTAKKTRKRTLLLEQQGLKVLPCYSCQLMSNFSTTVFSICVCHPCVGGTMSTHLKCLHSSSKVWAIKICTFAQSLDISPSILGESAQLHGSVLNSFGHSLAHLIYIASVDSAWFILLSLLARL